MKTGTWIALAVAVLLPNAATAADGDATGAETPTPPDIWNQPAGTAIAPGAVPGGRKGRSIAVFDPVGVGVESPACQAVGDLLRQELVKLGNSVSPRSMMGEGSCADEACASERGQKLMVKEAVVTRISRLDQKVLIMSTLVDVASGRPIYTDRITAASLDDFDVLAVRVARGLDGKVPFAQTMTMDTISEYESTEQKRRRSVVTTGVRLAGLVPVGGSYAGVSYLYSAEALTMYEVKQYAIETSVGFRSFNESGSDTRIGVGTLDIGAYYHLNQMDFSPYIGGAVGLHYVGASWIGDEDKVTGEKERQYLYAGAPAFSLGGGATLLRSSDVHVVASMKYTLEVVNIDNQPAHGLMLGLGVTYVNKGGRTCCIW